MSNQSRVAGILALCLMVTLGAGIGAALAETKKSTVQKSPESYSLGYGDIIDVLVWKEPDFSLENTVIRLDGKITLPLVSDVTAAGRTTRQLKSTLESVLRKYIDNPVVTVILREARSQRFYILGEVIQAGEYPLSKELTVLQAFAIAGGFTEWANKKEIFVLRRNDKGDSMIRINYHDILSGKDLKGNIVLLADDTIMVP
ncbi:polysaccharide biosynthesis/export family protein [Desulfoluna spongiiphila]|uniref:Polysaccharide export outer membrane protein n=1 Tax=Desulfoluna spongiiphila TaxID=419481 RepID=A0A1G5C223_9BACT|nr:polysaccharide biosynthesis/export family protein [Desulfoluna spongiiphila]SCX96485.1 polysaccharide export outer membrane protein [Desulfoluna spongiiphila]VVS94063.1 polysaccharide export protein [Desulfoluna spongiiphila]